MFSGGCKRISGTWVGMVMELRRKEELNKQVSLGSGIGRRPFSCDGNGADCSGLFISFLLPRSTYSIWAREWCGVFPVVHDPLGTGILKRRHCGQRQVTHLFLRRVLRWCWNFASSLSSPNWVSWAVLIFWLLAVVLSAHFLSRCTFLQCASRRASFLLLRVGGSWKSCLTSLRF